MYYMLDNTMKDTLHIRHDNGLWLRQNKTQSALTQLHSSIQPHTSACFDFFFKLAHVRRCDEARALTCSYFRIRLKSG